MSTTFHLVRHGLKERRIGDVSLTAEGSLQAEATALHFAKAPLPITKIVSSPLRRAVATAEKLAHHTHSLVIEDFRLRERANWGDCPDQTFEQFIAMWDQCTANPEYIPPVGDSAKQAGERLASILTELAHNERANSNIIVVTHGGLITDFLIQTFTERELNVWHSHFIAMQNRLIPECSITTLIHDNGNYKIEALASTDHLNL
ncbi:histidine phosphatase family protein [Paenibacillus xylanilyticus]|uniref:Histidine phosphatase family protein n=1 Tax=Paenibacillus xylanilyticus TaxID=248903 RepID=A0A7Y6EYC1_9BACL|nr:histidine phosphatase family protein [Paenibacillus xylanilyticus]NUU78370.1 histidine phosphatase family protein [Paenibacillus xylanilyticus]